MTLTAELAQTRRALREQTDLHRKWVDDMTLRLNAEARVRKYLAQCRMLRQEPSTAGLHGALEGH